MPHVIALVDDLLFLSRIRESARGSGLKVQPVRGAEEALASARQGASLVLVDADSSRLPWRDAVSALRADAALAAVPVVAFLSHVRADRAEAAREVGCTRVLARGAFVQALPDIVAAAAATHPEEPTP